MKKLVLVLLLAAAGSVYARLGETLEECKVRFTNVGQTALDQFTFSSGNITITVHLRNGRSVREDFAPERGDSLSESDVSGVLQENAEGSSWEITGETATYISYMRKDGRATAQKAKPNTNNPSGNVKLSIGGAELIIKYTTAGISALPAASS